MNEGGGKYEVGVGGFIEVETARGGPLEAEDLMGTLMVLAAQPTGDAKVALTGTTRSATGLNSKRRIGYHAAERLTDMGLVEFREKMAGAAGKSQGGREVRITQAGAELVQTAHANGKLSLVEALAKTEAGVEVAERLVQVWGRLAAMVETVRSSGLV